MGRAGGVKLTWLQTPGDEYDALRERPMRVIYVDPDRPRRFDHVLVLRARAIARGYTPFVIIRSKSKRAKRRSSKGKRSPAR